MFQELRHLFCIRARVTEGNVNAANLSEDRGFELIVFVATDYFFESCNFSRLKVCLKR